LRPDSGTATPTENGAPPTRMFERAPTLLIPDIIDCARIRNIETDT
jgi:hypothetical protein